MTDVAALGLKVDSSSIRAASANLSNMTVAAWNAQKGTGALAKITVTVH